MKKFIIIFTMLFSVILVNAQEVKQKEELASVQVVNTIYDRTTEAITELATALKAPAEHVYEVLVKQATINSISAIIIIITVMIASILMIIIPYKDRKRANKNYLNQHPSRKESDPDYEYYDWDEGYWLWVMIPGYCLLTASIIAIPASIEMIMSGLINPEYQAIQSILNIL